MSSSSSSSITYTLIGPPECHHPLTTGTAPASDTVPNLPGNRIAAQPVSIITEKTLTENSSPTFASSGDACLDFFFHVVPGTSPSTMTSLLSDAWAADPITALRLIFNLRGIRGTGKSDREGFYTAALWLYSHHPSTLAMNADSIAAFGYLKDLPEMLHRVIHGGVSTKTRPKKDDVDFLTKRVKSTRIQSPKDSPSPRPGTAEDRIAASLASDRSQSEAAAIERRRKRAEAAARVVQRYKSDPRYRLLHDRTADVFATLLTADLEMLAQGQGRSISLAAKWCPSLDSAYDYSTLLCEAVARRLFPRGSSDDLGLDLPDIHYVYRARERLRKKVLIPLRLALQLPEIFMSARAWSDVIYTRVASVAMNNYKSIFEKHDAERFSQYLEDVRAGKKKIAAGALLPHQIVYAEDDVADLQWKRMISDMKAIGSLTNCIAVCDVSGSMSGLPMKVCVALGMLVSELSDEPWSGNVITFSAKPQLHRIQGETLREKVSFVERMEWGMNTNFQAVFDRILDVAVQAGLPPDRMIKRVFVFSDMEFDSASSQPWETDYEAIQRKFTAAGYGDVVPEIVFWNLRESTSVPVTVGQKGVALLSGFSKNLLKLFLEGGGVVSPRAVMDQAISGPEYQKLVVPD